RSCAYLGEECRHIPQANILIHPSPWGNAAALALMLLEIRQRNPCAYTIFVPSGNPCQPIPELYFALKIAFHSLQRDPTKVFLIRSPFQQEWNSLVAAPVAALLMLYRRGVPRLLNPLLEHVRTRDRRRSAEENILVCENAPKGDLYDDVLTANPRYLKRLPLAGRVMPGPIHRAAMLRPTAGSWQPTYH